MTWPLSVGVPSLGLPVIGSRRHFTPTATARAMAQDFRKKAERDKELGGNTDRTAGAHLPKGYSIPQDITLKNKTITDFFKPVLNQDLGHKDRTVLCSPDRGNIRDTGIGLSVQRFEKKIPSPKVRRKKMPDQTPNTSPVGNGCPLRKIPHPSSRETASDFIDDPAQPKQVSKHEASSPSALKTSSDMAAGIWKSQSISPCCLRFKMSPGRSKPMEFPGKRKRTAMSMDADCSNQSEVPSFNDKAFSRSSAICKNRRPTFVKPTFLKSTCGDVLQLTEVASLPRHDSALPDEYLNSNDKSEKNNCAVSSSSSYSAYSPGKNNHISVVDTKENQLQVANSRFFLEKSLPFSQEKSTVLPSLHHLTQTKVTKSHLQNAALSQVLDTYKKEQEGKRPERHSHSKAYSIQFSSSSSKTIDKTSENASGSCAVEGSGEPVFSEETGKSAHCSLPFKERCIDGGHVSSQLSGELEVESTSTNKSELNGKTKSSFDSEDENLEHSLDDDDSNEEEVFLPLQEILSSSPKTQSGALEELCLDSFFQDTNTPLLKLHGEFHGNLRYFGKNFRKINDFCSQVRGEVFESQFMLSKPPVVSQVSYVNSLEHLLKEKEESKRIDELEKQLLEDMQGGETDSSDGEDKESGNGDEDLAEEHRAFIKRFSIVAHAIPNIHPGEDIFDLSTSGKIFNQHNLDLRNFYFIPQNPKEKLLLSSGVTQQLYLAINGFLSSAYSCILCPIPILKWLFQMMSVHSDYCVSTHILRRLMDITLKNASISDEQSKPWTPSLADVSTVFVNMGVGFRSLFPLQHLQPSFNECDILNQMQETVSKHPRGDLTSASPSFSSLPENNLINVIKFLGFCTTVIQGGYTDQEILLLLLLLFKISLEKQLKQVPLIDFQCLFVELLMNIRDWDTKMPELCLAVSELSNHHHNLLWLVQLVPSWIVRGREVRRRLSLVIISKLLNKKDTEIPDDSDKQMSLLRQFLVYMKPSYLLKKMRKELEQQNADGDHLHTELEQEAYYLIYILLHLVSEASFFDVVNSNQRQHLLKLCGVLDKHIKCDIREDARLFYRTKVKDLVARIYGKWQDMIQTTRPTQGKLHDFWKPDK